MRSTILYCNGSYCSSINLICLAFRRKLVPELLSLREGTSALSVYFGATIMSGPATAQGPGEIRETISGMTHLDTQGCQTTSDES